MSGWSNKRAGVDAGFAVLFAFACPWPGTTQRTLGGVTRRHLHCPTGMGNSDKAAGGFTLVEMLVVIAVVAILAAFLLPAISASKRKAQRAACINNLRHINLGVRMYSDDSHDASPSAGVEGSTPTNIVPLYAGYKALMKNYVGLNGASSSQDRLFACPADTFYPSWILPDASSPVHFVRKSIHDESLFDYSSYAFSGGDNRPRQFGTLTPTYPGLTGIKLSSVRHPARTVLVAEIAALAPWSWHAPSSHGVAYKDGTRYNDSQNVVSFVDGHVSYIKMYWNPGHGLAGWYDPPASYGYKWSPD